MIWQLAAGLALASVVMGSKAQPLRDPTQPPAAVKPSRPVGKAARTDIALQTVVISPQRRIAVISGRVMSVGDTIHGYRLMEIRETEVVMKGARGSRTLRLYPAVKKVAATMETPPEETKGRE